MNIEEIEKIIKDYLISKKVDFEAKCDKDNCSLDIKKIGDFYYAETHASYFKGILYPGDENYPSQSEGCPCENYRTSQSYMLVYDKNGNIIIDLTKISMDMSNFNIIKFLDDKNLILPIASDKYYLNDFQHYKIEDGKLFLLKTLNGRPDFSNTLLKNKLVAFDEKLYNFETGIFLYNDFSKIFTGNKYDIYQLADAWRIPQEQREEFVDTIIKKMKENNLIAGYKKVEVTKDGVYNNYDTFIFIGKNGNVVSDLYYLDDYNLLSIANVTTFNYEFVIQQLKHKLVSKIDAILLEQKMEQEKKKEILPQLIKRLTL